MSVDRQPVVGQPAGGRPVTPPLIHLTVWGEDLVGLGADGTVWEGKWDTCKQNVSWRLLASPEVQ